MQKIELPCVFGRKSKDKLIGGSDIVITLCEGYLTTRANYKYHGFDDLEIPIEKKVNEKCFIKKEFISQIAAGYDDKMDVYFVGVAGVGFDSYINVESAEKGNEVLNTLRDWWLS